MTALRHIFPEIVRPLLLLTVMLAAAILAGCDNTIEPLDDSEGDQFAVQGYLDMAEDVQIVRVEGLRPSILGEPIDMQGVIVTTRDHETGEIIEWDRQTIEGDDGDPVTLYSAEFRPAADRLYTMEIHRPGRAGTVATTRIPARPGLVVAEPVNLVQTVFLSDLPRSPDFLAMQYDVIVPESNRLETVEIIYEQDGVPANIRNRLDVRLVIDRFIVLGRLSRDDNDAPLTLAEIGLLIRLPSREFERSAGSGNISNGEGFFGSVARFEYTWRLSGDVVQDIGYEDGQQSG